MSEICQYGYLALEIIEGAPVEGLRGTRMGGLINKVCSDRRTKIEVWENSTIARKDDADYSFSRMLAFKHNSTFIKTRVLVSSQIVIDLFLGFYANFRVPFNKLMNMVCNVPRRAKSMHSIKCAIFLRRTGMRYLNWLAMKHTPRLTYHQLL